MPTCDSSRGDVVDEDVHDWVDFLGVGLDDVITALLFPQAPLPVVRSHLPGLLFLLLNNFHDVHVGNRVQDHLEIRKYFTSLTPNLQTYSLFMCRDGNINDNYSFGSVCFEIIVWRTNQNFMKCPAESLVYLGQALSRAKENFCVRFDFHLGRQTLAHALLRSVHIKKLATQF